MAKNGKSIGVTLTSILVGVDIGYGKTKAVTPGQSPIIFDSVWGHARKIKFGADKIAKNHPGEQITDEDGDWFVGSLALSQISAGEQLKLRGRTADESTMGNVARVRLLKVALGKLFPGQQNGDVIHFTIATGLPVDHMPEAEELKAALIGLHVIHTDATNFVAHITEVIVMPQPYGTVYRNMLTQQGEINPCHTFVRTGVIDIGTFTTDLAVDDDGEYVDDQSGSVEAGMSIVQQQVSDAYERIAREKPRLGDLETIIHKKCILLNSKPEDFTADVEDGLIRVRDAILTLASAKWGTAARIDVIYVAGGGAGAKLIFDEIKRVYPQARLVEDYQYSNAQGYLQYAVFKARG